MSHHRFFGDSTFKGEIAELQDAYASRQFRDELKRIERRRRLNKTSITRDRGQRLMVKRLLRIRLSIDNRNNYKRPHLHVDYGRNFHAASYAIDTGERLAGGLDGKYDKQTRQWIERNRKKLLKAWKQIQSGHNSDRIVAELKAAH
jgi:hypothetical protein